MRINLAYNYIGKDCNIESFSEPGLEDKIGSVKNILHKEVVIMPRWTYRIVINNNTDKPLELLSSDIPWGFPESEFPKNIAPNDTGVYGVYSPAGVAYGIEFYITMRSMPEGGEKSYGSLTLSVDMPYWKHENQSSLTCTGILIEEGFKKVPDGAHDFAVSVDIITNLNKSTDEEHETAFQYEETNIAPSYNNLYDWNSAKNVKVIDPQRTVARELLPDINPINKRITAGRTEAVSIPKSKWKQIKDIKFPGEYSKGFLKDYFTVVIYELRKNKTLSLAENQSYEKEVSISNSSSVRRETSQQFHIENTINVSGSIGDTDLSMDLRVMYEINSLEEYCEQSQINTRELFSYGAVDYERDIVLWSLVKVLCLYREKPDGKIEPVGIGDYLMENIQKVYKVTTETPRQASGERECTDSEYLYVADDGREEFYNLIAGADAGGSIIINNVNYKWREIHISNSIRGIIFSSQGAKPKMSYTYSIYPNPHEDGNYKKDARRRYAKLANEVKKFVERNAWQSSLTNLNINGITYTLTKQ